MGPERSASRKPAGVERRAGVVRAPVAPVARAAPAGAALQQRLGNGGTQAYATQKMQRTSGAHGGASDGRYSLSRPGDGQEREAHTTADAVMRMGDPSRRTNAEAAAIRARAGGNASAAGARKIAPALSSRIQALQGGGSPLPNATRAFFEPRFGADFRGVRVHTGRQAAETAGALGARAFTSGQDIAFSEGKYAPQSQEGQRLLAHELTHVVQQSGRRSGVVYRWEELEHKTTGNRAQNEFPYRGTLQTDMTALRSAPRKERDTPHATTTADLRTGAQVLVVGKERGWLKVLVESGAAVDKKGASVSAQSLTGFVSHELVKKSAAVFDAELPIGGGLMLSYGDVVAMGGDHFKDFAQLSAETGSSVGVGLLKKLRDTIDASATKSVKYEDEATIAKAYAERFMSLALVNIPHFSMGGSALATWQQMHVEAVGQAFQAGIQGDGARLSKAYAMNAFADHFLTDSFSSGHVRVPREQIILYYKKLAADVFQHIIDHLTERLGNRIYELLQHDYARVRQFGDDADRRDSIARVRTRVNAMIARAGGAAALQEKFGLYVAGAFSKILHDDENAAGLDVVSKKHPEGWQAFGDNALGTPANAKNLAYMTEAVKTSKADLIKAFNIGVDVRIKHGRSPTKAVVDAAVADVAKKVGPPHEALDWTPRVAAGVAPLPQWEWGKLDKPMRARLVAMITKYLTTSVQTDLLSQIDATQEVEVNGPNVIARPRDAARDILAELMADPIRFLEQAIGRSAGP